MSENKQPSMPLLEALIKQYPEGYPPAPKEKPTGTTVADLIKKGGRWKIRTTGAVDTTSGSKTEPKRSPA